MNALRVVVADDHGLTLSAVSDSLRAHGLFVEARATNARDAVNAVVKCQPDALLIDLDLGAGPSGIHVAVNLRRRFPALGITILSGYADPRLLSVGIPEAPTGTVYLVKSQISDVSSVVDAVRECVDRAKTGAPSTVPEIDLTRSQVAVLDLVAEGLTNGAIAERLFISEKSVAKYINRIAKRLGVSGHRETNTRGALTSHYHELVGNRRRA